MEVSFSRIAAALMLALDVEANAATLFSVNRCLQLSQFKRTIWKMKTNQEEYAVGKQGCHSAPVRQAFGAWSEGYLMVLRVRVEAVSRHALKLSRWSVPVRNTAREFSAAALTSLLRNKRGTRPQTVTWVSSSPWLAHTCSDIQMDGLIPTALSSFC